MLILQIVIAPLQIMLDLIPGQQGFGPWIRNLIADASVFATVPIMLAIQHILSGNWITNSFFLKLNTLSGSGGVKLNLPYMGSKLESTDFIITWLVGFTIFSLTPKIADMIRDALKVPAFKYGAAFGEALGPIVGVANLGLSPIKSRFDVASNVYQDVGKDAKTIQGKMEAYSRARLMQEIGSRINIPKPK